MTSKLDTQQTHLADVAGGTCQPRQLRITRLLMRIGLISVIAALVLAFAAVLAAPRLAALGAGRPAAGCPAPPSSHSPGAFLYLVSPLIPATRNPPLPVERPVPPARLRVCGIDFHAHSMISFSTSQRAGGPFVLFGPTVTSDANGSFSALLLAPPTYCSTGGAGARLRARDALGATAVVALPATNPPAGFPPRAPLGPAGPGGPSGPAFPCPVID